MLLSQYDVLLSSSHYLHFPECKTSWKWLKHACVVLLKVISRVFLPEVFALKYGQILYSRDVLYLFLFGDLCSSIFSYWSHDSEGHILKWCIISISCWCLQIKAVIWTPVFVILMCFSDRDRDRDRDNYRDRDRRRDRSRSREHYRDDRRGGGGGSSGRGLKGRQPGGSLRKPHWDLSRLQPFRKDFYVPHPDVANKPQHEVEEYRSSKEITLKGRSIPNPVWTFDEAGFPDYVMKEIRYFY